MEELTPHFPELEILELSGAGGMGAVYKAHQLKSDRFVALKILSRDLTGDPAFLERFNREARMLARLMHANIVSVFDTGTAGPFAFLIMEYVDGVNLRQAMRAGRFTPAETLTLVENICAALKFAHEKGILHRDIKPENILIDSQGQGEDRRLRHRQAGRRRRVRTGDAHLPGRCPRNPSLHGTGAVRVAGERGSPRGHLFARRGVL